MKKMQKVPFSSRNTEKQSMTIILILTCILLIFSDFPFVAGNEVETSLQTYIVHVNKPEGEGSHRYDRFLPENRRIYSYKHVMSGFAAKLTAEEAEAMKRTEGFISIHPQRSYSLHTTHSPSFLGLHQNFGVWNQSNYGKGVVIGMLDSGITPEHPSFNDEGMPAPPADSIGHGTHTSSTAAGAFVKDADVFGLANGTAVGIAPLAHLAVYKVCDASSCDEPNVLAGMDAAVDDGVDIISASLGRLSVPFHKDVVAQGALAAARKGILVSCSAGNFGPHSSALFNDAPWILTVGASTTDRTISATARIGDGQTFDGESLFQANITWNTQSPLVYAGAFGDASVSTFCVPGSLNASIQGKVVLCERNEAMSHIEAGQEVKNNGGAAMIHMNSELHGYSTVAEPDVLPTIHVSYAAGESIKAYIKSSANPTATILFQGTKIGKKSAPEVASFSSRGPSATNPGILKPDIIGPGVNILAAWPVSVENKTNTKSTFNVISGSSMACPHLSGIAALLKSSHPDWSPAAIKSAIMTTTDVVNLEGKPIVDQTNHPANVFATGSGHVNPSRANDPGLIYDIHPDSYIPHLCGLNYTDIEVQMIVNRAVKCATASTIPEAALNYPSFSIIYGKYSARVQEHTRTVTNVGPANSHYVVDIVSPDGLTVEVSPNNITFTEVNQKVTYSVKFTRSSPKPNLTFSQGHLKWVSRQHNVKSPIAVVFNEDQ